MQARHKANSTLSSCNHEQTFLQAFDGLVALETFPEIITAKTYFHAGMPGTTSTTLIREAVALKLAQVAKNLGADYRLKVYDAFRTIEAQAFLFESFRACIAADHPEWTEDLVLKETLRFASPPTGGRFSVCPHNSGGSVDLTLCTIDSSGAVQVLDMGTEFDAITSKSSTAFFDHPFDPKHDISETRWQRIRSNRMILRNAMESVGFTNYREEWWHYDLGSPLWAEATGSAWHYPAALV